MCAGNLVWWWKDNLVCVEVRTKNSQKKGNSDSGGWRSIVGANGDLDRWMADDNEAVLYLSREAASTFMMNKRSK